MATTYDGGRKGRVCSLRLTDEERAILDRAAQLAFQRQETAPGPRWLSRRWRVESPTEYLKRTGLEAARAVVASAKVADQVKPRERKAATRGAR